MHCLGSTCHFLRILIPFEEPPHLTADKVWGAHNAFFLNDLKSREKCLSFALCGLKSCGHGGHRTQQGGFVALIFLKSFIKFVRIVDTAKLKN